MVVYARHLARLCPVLVGILCVVALGRPAAASCGPSSGTRVVVDQLLPETTHDFNKSEDEIFAMAAGNPHLRNGTILGLTTARSWVSAREEIRTVAQNDGTFCVYLVGLTIDFGYRNMDVYVLRQVRGDSCLEPEVLQHEHHHVDISRRTLAEFAPRMQAEVTAATARAGVIQIRTQPEMTARLTGVFQTAMEQVFREFRETLAERQEAFDSPAEYRRLSTTCANHVRELLSEAR